MKSDRQDRQQEVSEYVSGWNEWIAELPLEIREDCAVRSRVQYAEDQLALLLLRWEVHGDPNDTIPIMAAEEMARRAWRRAVIAIVDGEGER